MLSSTSTAYLPDVSQDQLRSWGFRNREALEANNIRIDGGRFLPSAPSSSRPSSLASQYHAQIPDGRSQGSNTGSSYSHQYPEQRQDAGKNAQRPLRTSPFRPAQVKQSPTASISTGTRPSMLATSQVLAQLMVAARPLLFSLAVPGCLLQAELMSHFITGL